VGGKKADPFQNWNPLQKRGGRLLYLASQFAHHQGGKSSDSSFDGKGIILEKPFLFEDAVCFLKFTTLKGQWEKEILEVR